MFKIQFKAAVRFLKTNLGYVFNSTLSLVLGIVSFVIIVFWVQHEFSYDDFHEDGERIHRVVYNLYEEGKLELSTASAVPAIGPKLMEETPDIESMVRIRKTESMVKYNSTQFKETKIFYSDPDFFKVFSFKLIDGERGDNILDINKMVITESASRRYFGNESAIGKTVILNNRDKYTISAVVENPPSNSHFDFEFLISMQNMLKNWRGMNEDWFATGFYTYVKTKKGVDADKIEEKSTLIVEKYLGDFMKRAMFLNEFKLQKLSDIHLKSARQHELKANGSYQMLWFLVATAILIISISFVNFFNLSMAKYYERIKNSGINRVLGAYRHQIVLQPGIENGLLILGSTTLSITVIYAVLPIFNAYMNTALNPSLASLTIILLAIAITGYLVTYVLPSIVLSARFDPELLKGKKYNDTKLRSASKNAFVVFQFAASVALITSTLSINRQLDYMQQKNLGFDMEDLIVFERPSAPVDSIYRGKLLRFSNQFKNQSDILSSTTSSAIPGKEIFWKAVMGKFVSGVNTEKKVNLVGIDKNFISTYNLKLISGKDFDETSPFNIDNVILNESAVKYFDLGSPDEAVNKILCAGERRIRVKCVINDYHHLSLKEKPEPTAYFNNNGNKYFSLKVNRANRSKVVAYVREKWSKVMNNNSLHHFYLDDFYNAQYKADERLRTLFSIASLIAIIIACSGLFSLSLQYIQQKTKEIGIRKVNGATVLDILRILNIKGIRMVFISLIVATPITYYVIVSWQDNFVYKSGFSWTIFALSASLVLIISQITNSWHTVRAATQNPVKALRYE